MRVTDSIFWYTDSSSSLVTQGPRRCQKVVQIRVDIFFLEFSLTTANGLRAVPQRLGGSGSAAAATAAADDDDDNEELLAARAATADPLHVNGGDWEGGGA